MLEQQAPQETNNTAAIMADHLVGNLYYNLDAVPVMASILDPATMRLVASPEAAIAYSEMCRLVRSQERLSAGSLEAGLRSQKFNFDWLSRIQSRLTTDELPILHLYAEEVVNAGKLWKIRQACNVAAESAGGDGAKADKIAGDLMLKLAADGAGAKEIEHASTITERVRAKLERIKSGQMTWGAPTGWKNLDAKVQLVDGELIVIAGAPSQGKTALARQMFLHRLLQMQQAGEDGQVVFFSADDTAEKFISDLASTISYVNFNRIRYGHAERDEWQRYEDALAFIDTLPLLVDDTPKPTVEQIYYRCAMLNAQKRIRLAAMDYMSLIRVPEAKSERQEAELAASGCKGIGNTFNFPFVLLSQIKKSVNERRDKWPTPSDLMYAGEAESNVCLLVMRPEHYIARGEEVDCSEADREGVALINVGKNKTGDVGMVRLGYRKDIMQFWDIEVERHELNDY